MHKLMFDTSVFNFIDRHDLYSEIEAFFKGNKNTRVYITPTQIDELNATSDTSRREKIRAFLEAISAIKSLHPSEWQALTLRRLIILAIRVLVLEGSELQILTKPTGRIWRNLEDLWTQTPWVGILQTRLLLIQPLQNTWTTLLRLIKQ